MLEDKWMGDLKRKDELILELKAALLLKDRRITDLEIALSEFERSPKSPDERSPTALAHSSDASEQPAHHGQGNVSDVERVIIYEASTGFYPDGWTGLETTLVLNPNMASSSIRLQLYLPERNTGSNEKLVVVSPSFADPEEIKVVRGEILNYSAHIPDHVLVPPHLRLTIDTPEPTSSDVRMLGIVILSASVIL